MISCDRNSLAQAAACYCGRKQLQESELTFLLAALAGGSTDPKTIAAQAVQWMAMDQHYLVAVKAYLTALLANGSMDPATLAAASVCYCYPENVERAVWIYLRNSALNTPYTPAALRQASACFCYNDRTQRAVQGYLLAVLASGSLDPFVLSKAASGFIGLPDNILRMIRTYNTCIWANFTADPVDDWAARVVKNGGAAPSAPTISAMKTFVDTLKGANIYTKMRAMNVFAPDNLIACCTPLVHRFGSDPWTNSGFAPGALSVNGLTGDSVHYLDTGFIPHTGFAIEPPTNCGFSLVDFGVHAGLQCEMGVSNVGATSLLLLAIGALTMEANVYGIQANSGHLQYLNLTNNQNWFMTVNRDDAVGQFGQLSLGNAGNPFASRATNASNASNSSQLPGNRSTYIFARNQDGNVVDVTNRRVAFAAFHDALNFAQQQTLYTAVNTLRGAFGGGTF